MKFYSLFKTSVAVVLLFFMVHTPAVFAQTNNGTQTVRGVVTDKASEVPLVGVDVIVEGTEPLLGTTTNERGQFVLTNVPLGRQAFRMVLVGYKAATIPEILVTAGKEVILDGTLEEAVETIKAVTIKADAKKDRPLNEFSTVSARTFSMEEVTRYSGGRNDVGRLVSNYAGVGTASDARNDIVVRGNSPAGVLWRLEGVPIPSPNHFSTLGTTGGPVSALNTNLLRNSDFLTGAFAAEYGNANAGVFDIGFRSGNTEKHEYTFQLAAFSGFEGMAEGPLTKRTDGGNAGSYVVAYRYSFAGIGSKLGIPIGTKAAPQYNDLSFKIDLPSSTESAKRYGKFSVFGIAAYSFIDFIGKELTEEDLFANPRTDQYVKSGFGVVGVKHTLSLGHNDYLKTTLAGTFEASLFNQFGEHGAAGRIEDVKSTNYTTTVRLSSYYNRKYSARLNFRAGIVAELYHLDTDVQDREYTPDWFQYRKFSGELTLLQPFAEVNYKLTNKLTLNGGLHGQYLTLNGSQSLEPRAALTYQLAPNQSISVAYGYHSQMQPLPVYFYEPKNAEGIPNISNRSLDFTRSQHFVIAYDLKIRNNWRVKLEPYLQLITDAPINRQPSTFSMLNAGADFVYPDSANLVNKGLGRNAGIELTVEKFFSEGFYGLFTASGFRSQYLASDGEWRNTTFNGGYIVNVLAGKEFKVGARRDRAFTTDMKFTTSGGKWYTPINLAASKASGQQVLDETQAYTQQYPAYLRLDLKFGYRVNNPRRKISQTFFIDFQNVTFRKNVFYSKYNPTNGQINNVYQIGFFPDVLYRIQF